MLLHRERRNTGNETRRGQLKEDLRATRPRRAGCNHTQARTQACGSGARHRGLLDTYVQAECDERRAALHPIADLTVVYSMDGRRGRGDSVERLEMCPSKLGHCVTSEEGLSVCVGRGEGNLKHGGVLTREMHRISTKRMSGLGLGTVTTHWTVVPV